jgi:hypothetical protein
MAMGVCEHAGLMQLQRTRDGRRPVPARSLRGNRQAWNDWGSSTRCGRWPRHFSHCTGVDVAETMIEQATRLDPGSACTFVVNETNDAEFLRVLEPAGLLAFRLPTRMPPRTLRNKLCLRTRAYAALRAAGFDQRMLYERLNLVPVMQMQCIPEEGVRTDLRLLGAAVLEVQGGRFEVGELESATYFVIKSNGR